MTIKALSYRDLALIVCCSAVNLATSYAVAVAFPIIPLHAHTHNISETQAGGILGASSFAYLLSSPAIGFALLRWNCRTLIISGLLLIAFGQLVFAAEVNAIPSVLIFARIIIGVGNASAEIAAMTLVSRQYTDHIGKCMSAFEVCQGIGWIIAPSFAGYLFETWGPSLGFSAPFVAGALLSLLILLYTLLVVPPGELPHREKDPLRTPLEELGAGGGQPGELSMRETLRQMYHPCLVLTALALFLYSVTLSSVFSTVVEDAGLGSRTGGELLTVQSILYILFSPVVGYLSDTYGCNRALMGAGLTLAGICTALLGPSPLLRPLGYHPPDRAPDEPRIFQSEALTLAVLGISEALVVAPAFPELLANCRLNIVHSSGPLSALFSGTWSAGEAVGPMFGMVTVETYGFPWGSTIFSGVCIACAITILVPNFHKMMPSDSKDLESQAGNSEENSVASLSPQESLRCRNRSQNHVNHK